MRKSKTIVEVKRKAVASVLLLEALHGEEEETKRSFEVRLYVWKGGRMGLFNFLKEFAIEDSQVYLKKLEGEDDSSPSSMLNV